eukprot:Skav219254  [mRNA]  locus=scaffold1242:325652:347129:+ [translate_table: standard]
MERVQAVRDRGCTPRGCPSPRRPLTAEVLQTESHVRQRRLLKTPRVFHKSQGISHIKRNELRANLLPCILQTPSSDRKETDERCEFKKRLDYQSIIGTRSESENEVKEMAFLEKSFNSTDFPEEWDPAWQAANACSELEGRLAAVVHPERGALAKLVRALQQKETEAQGLQAVLNNLLREVSKPLPALEISMESSERLRAMLAEPRRSLERLLSVSDRLAALVDRLASSCNSEIEKLLQIRAPPAFTVANSMQTETEFYFAAGEEAKKLRPSELSFQQHTDVLENIEELTSEEEDEEEAAASQLKEQVALLQLLVRTWVLLQHKLGLDLGTPWHSTWNAKSTKASRSGQALYRRGPAEVLDIQILGNLDMQKAFSSLQKGNVFLCSQLGSKGLHQRPSPKFHPSDVSFPQWMQNFCSEQSAYGCRQQSWKCVASGAELDIQVLEAAIRVDEELLAEAEQILAMAQYSGGEKPEVLKERLFNAVNDGELSVAKACLDANSESPVRLPVDVVDEDGNTPLSEAACYGEIELVEFFLSRGAHPDSRNELGRTPIWRACYNGHFEVNDGHKRHKNLVGRDDEIGFRELSLALSAAHDLGKVALVVANGLEEVERYLHYACEGLIDGKQLIGEVFIKKNQSLEEAKEMLRDLLLSAMETHGVGVSLHLRMGDSACDIQRFCADSLFPAEVFGGPRRWTNEEVLRHFPHSGISLQNDFQLAGISEIRAFVEQAVCNLCRMVLQFANNPKVLLFATMCDIVTSGELQGKLPKVVNDVDQYLESPKMDYLFNLPFDAVHTMSEFMTAIKNVKRSKQFAGADDGSVERIPRHDADHRGVATLQVS